MAQDYDKIFREVLKEGFAHVYRNIMGSHQISEVNKKGYPIGVPFFTDIFFTLVFPGGFTKVRLRLELQLICCLRDSVWFAICSFRTLLCCYAYFYVLHRRQVALS
jgi:hypothetical protein